MDVHRLSCASVHVEKNTVRCNAQGPLDFRGWDEKDCGRDENATGPKEWSPSETRVNGGLWAEEVEQVTTQTPGDGARLLVDD